jgi:solute carrier family 38 (sodium-coupled neutral amino acid transporter), member 11
MNPYLGSGILNQPFVFYDSGVLGGVVGYILASSMTWLGINILTAAGLKSHLYEYGTLTKYALGRKGEILIDVSIIIGCFGALLGYILVVGSTISGLLGSWGCESDACGMYLTTIICVTLFVLPVCLFRHFGHLAWLSLFSVFAIACVLFLVIIGGPLLASSGSVRVFNAIGTINSLGSIVFSLSCASANFQAFITTKRTARNRRSWMWVTAAVVIIGSLMCVAMGIAGYLSFKSDTEGIILDNFEGPQFDFFKIMVAAHLILYVSPWCISYSLDVNFMDVMFL